MKKRSDPDVSEVSSRMIGKVIGRSRTKVLDYIKRGILPPAQTGGKYNLYDAVQRYVYHVKKGRVDSTEEDEKRSILGEKLRSMKLENRRRMGEVVDVTEVEEVFMWCMSLVAMRLEGLPGRLSTELATTSDPAMIRKRLQHEISDIRTSAQRGLTAFVDRCKGRGHYQEPSTESARRVGRSKPRPARRITRARSMEE